MPEMANASACEDSNYQVAEDALAQRISLMLSQGSAWILVTGNTHKACLAFLDRLSNSLTNSAHVLKISIPSKSTNLSEQASAVLGIPLLPGSTQNIPSERGNVYLLCHAEGSCQPEDFEQLRQLSNLQPKLGHLGIVLCGKRNLLHQLPSAIRQRIVSIYSLDDRLPRAWLRRILLGGLLTVLAIAAWAWVASLSIQTTRRNLPPPSQSILGASLKTGPVLAQPETSPEPEPLTHIFQNEDEAEAGLRTLINEVDTPSSMNEPPRPLPR